MLNRLKFLTAGESHGKGLTGILEGFPAGVPLTANDIDADLARRQLGHGRGGRMKIETDQVEILSGVRHGKTLGSPIALWIENRDWKNWKDDVMRHEPVEGAIKEITLPRPGHADLAGVQKFGFSDIRNVIERSSARETAIRVALGAVCKSLLSEVGIQILSHVTQIGPVVSAYYSAFKTFPDQNSIDASPVRCADAVQADQMVSHIDEMRKQGDSIGGRFEVIAKGVPPGLGSHTHWDRKLNARLAAAMMSINAMKAVSIGDGLDQPATPGSQVHDEIVGGISPFKRATNHAGGIEGGISNGEDILVQVDMKPIPTLAKPLKSIDIQSAEPGLAHKERTDSCAVPAASVVGESMLALVLADALLEKFGGDSLKQLKAHIEATSA